MIPAPFEIQVHELFLAHKWTLAAAESCTGGAVSATLTSIPGASAYFLGGVVVYSNQLKTKLLGVPSQLIKDKGAVSEEVAKKMTEGMLASTGSDFALAVTGIAGPDGGTASKPVGTVWCSVGRQGKKPLAWQINIQGTRAQVITGSVNALLDGLLRYAQHELRE